MSIRAVGPGLVFLLASNFLFGQQRELPPASTTVGFVSAAKFPGADWLAKVNAAAAALPKGGAIEVPDAIAGLATTTGSIPSNITLEFTGSATFGFCRMDMGQFSKIFNNDALLQLHGNDCIGINQSHSAILQKTDKFLLEGVRVDCNQQPNSTGIFVGIGHAQTSMRNITVVNCTTVGMRLEGAQFGEFANVSLYNNYVGLKIYSTAEGGGGNANTFYGLKVVGSTVGVVIAANSGYGMGADYFINPSLLENSVAAMAVFGNKWATDVHWYGGAPEHTGERKGGPETVTIDGRLIKRASIYANLSRVHLTEVAVAEASVNPFIRAENSSTVILNNISGYGNTGGKLVSADETSSTALQGSLGIVGTIENVVSYPSSLRGGHTRMIGAPIVSYNPLVPNAYTKDSSAPPIADTAGSVSSSTTNDAWLGRVTTVVHARARGTQEKNRVNFGAVVSKPTVTKSNILVSVLVKASVDCAYSLGAYAEGLATAHARLSAGQWTRIVIYRPNVAAGTGFTLVGFPEDASGPTVSFGRLEVLTESAGAWNSQGQTGLVLSTGAVNPNGSH